MDRLDRRKFLAALVAGAAGTRNALAVAGAGGLAGCSSPRGSNAAAAGEVTGEKLDRIGVQLYTVRDALARDFNGTLARIAAMGYKDLEFAGYAGQRPEAVSAALERLRLRAPAAHFPLDALRNQWTSIVDAAHVLDHDYIVLPWLDSKDRQTIEQYERLADELNQLGRKARQADLRLAYHNHDFEFVPLGGRVPFDVLVERTDPDLVEFELDLYWITMAGSDPLRYFETYPGRFPLVHVKDSGGPPAHTMTPVGSGTIDFKRIFGRKKDAGIEHAFVEHDNPTDPFASLKSSYDHLARLTF